MDTTTGTLRAVGMNDEQTQCDACGRVELRGTVIIADEDANEVGRYGTTCASKLLGEKVTRGQAVSLEAGRRQAVVNTLRQAKAATDPSARAWWLRELRFYTLHRQDERDMAARLLTELPTHWAVTVPNLTQEG